MKTRASGLLALGLAFAVLLGCEATETDAEGETSTDETKGEAETTEQTEGEDSKGKIAFTQFNFGNEWWETQVEGVRDQLDEMGYESEIVSAEGDSVTQNSQVRTFITQGFDAVIMNPTDPRGVRDAIKELNEADIPVVTVNSPLDDELLDKVYCYVSDDQVANSALIGEHMANFLAEEEGSDATVPFLMVAGLPGDLNAEQREEGFFEGYESVDDAPELDVLETVYGEWQADPAVGPTRSVATANPDLRALFVQTDSMIPGVQSALETVGIWDDVVVGGYDARMSVVKQMVDNPDGPVQATVANRPYEQGQLGVELAHEAIQGTPKEEVCGDNQRLVDPVVVTPDNGEEYYDPELPY